ncbi:2135_t:CDS:2 [Diversispora eburnea]|uniref:2135_t:CDS:1 n=1 Tax=Diversispora eburnea TaxID=1213867 RepID=A0A9N9GHY1_9GLOM|nr:2135_t:CDS:2 [Diversispora eburnea]
MNVDPWSNVGRDKKFSSSPENTLEFIVNLPSCGVGPMLNETCRKLQNFVGYYLDSVEIVVSPRPHSKSEMIVFKNVYMPQKHTSFDYSVGSEKTFDFNVNIRQNPGATASCNAKNKGFSVTIKQVLNFINKPKKHIINFRNNKPPVMKFPKMVHTLEIAFNDLKKFNKDFADLRENIHRGERALELKLGIENLDPDFLGNKCFKRELKLETQK